MSLYINRIKYKGGSPRLGASSGIINNAVKNGYYFYDDDYSPTHDYSLDYFTIESLEDSNTITLTKATSAPSVTIYYSLDNGENWSSNTGTTSWSLNNGEKIILKATTTAYASAENDNNRNIFSSTKTFNIYGNIMSLLYGDDFLNQTGLKGNYTFNSMFKNSMVVNAENLVMPGTVATNTCYASMFENCTNLITSPKELPLTSTIWYCCTAMFRGCTLLTTTPKLPCTNIQRGCYGGMFQNCINITESPILPATTLNQFCYDGMFNGCTSLNKVTCLATNISAYGCLTNWLNGVSSTGTFIKNSSMSSWSSGVSGIPSGWTVEDYTE